MARKRIVLIDGSSIIFRAYFAIPANFSTKDGLHTNAIYGFTMMFRKLLSGRTPDRGAVIFDAPGGTFRDDLYPDYKANRPRMAPELVEQLEWIDRVVEAHEFPLLRVPGYEADDVIGTLAKQAVDQDMDVVIVSVDKDFAQLISERVKMLDTLRDVTYDEDLVCKKWGVTPKQFVDYLALLGDKVDNIPGVPGIGAKGAAKLLADYGSMDGILENVESLKGRQKKNLIEFRPQALLSRSLATIDCQVPLDVTVDDLDYAAPDRGALNDLYRSLEFFSLLASDERDGLDDEADAAQCHICTSLADLRARLDAIGPGDLASVEVIYDLPHIVRGAWVGVAIATAADKVFYVPISGAGTALGVDAIGLLKLWFEDDRRPKIAHGVKQVAVVLARHGVRLEGVVGDSMLASFLVDPEGLIPHRLDQVVKQYLHRTIRSLKSVVGSGKSEKPFSQLDQADVGAYAGLLASAVYEVWPLLKARLGDLGQRAQLIDNDIPLSLVLAKMELRGIKVDAHSLREMGVDLGARLHTYEQEIHALAGHSFNIQSTKQLGKVLFDELGLPVVKRTKSGYSTNAEVLQRLLPKHPIAGVLLEHRKLAKLINTYTDVLQRELNPETGRIHATFQQTVGVSGRLITTDPDLQRTPTRTPEGKRIRETFITDPGYKLISADWSQIELRILAHFSQDETLLDAFNQGLDVHRRTAAEIFGCALEDVTAEQRNVGKTINFATIYGQGATALGQILGIPRKEAKAYIEGYFETYSRVREWRDETIARAHETGEVTTLLGRRRVIAELSSNSWMSRQAGERIAVNTPIQGSAADICKLAMLQIDRSLADLDVDGHMLLQIHDELIFEAPERAVQQVAEVVRTHMEQVYPLQVPLVVDLGIGDSWAEAH